MNTIKRKNGSRTVVESTWTYSEFVHHAEFRKKSERATNANCNSSRKKGDSKWSGTSNFKEALEFAKSGWDAGIDQLNISDGVLADTGIIYEPNVYGSVVNMPSYLDGQPDNMYNLLEEREYNLDPLTIYADLDYNAGQDGEKALNFTKSIVELVNKYQSSNNVKLVGVFYAEQSNNHEYFDQVLIKDFDSRFVINNIAFAFHPAFFRRLYFAHIEGQEHLSTGGYGRPAGTSKCHKYIIDNLHSGTEKALLLPNLSELRQDGIIPEDKIKKLNFTKND